MEKHIPFMQRALILARQGAGRVAPNPLVGCVMVCDGKIIGEGYHHEFGGPHAEVLAIKNVKDQDLLLRSTLYVTLEPCAHHGKTPPCSDLIISKGIPKVVIACRDPFPEVNGKGIEKLQSAGVEVISDVLKKEAAFLNRRFFTFHSKKRPYIILKWAESQDHFIDRKRESNTPFQNRITGDQSRMLVHKWRTEEASILVGKNTVLLDDPQLTARYYQGKQPLRIIIDKHLEIPTGSKVFSAGTDTLVINAKKNENSGNILYRTIDWENSEQSILELLYEMNILSLIIEGGTTTLERFIDAGLWDEARIFSTSQRFGEGHPAPVLKCASAEQHCIGDDFLSISYNPDAK